MTETQAQQLADVDANTTALVQMQIAREQLTREGMELLIAREKRRAAIDGFLSSPQLRYSGAFAVAILSLTLAAAWAGLLPDDFVGLARALRGIECPPGVPPELVPIQPAPATPAPVPVPA